MKNKPFYFVTGLLSLMLVLTGWDNYKADSFLLWPQEYLPFAPEEKGLTVYAKAFSPDESKKYLSTDLSKKGYQPIMITIANNTSKSYLISKEGIDLPGLSGKDMAFKVSKGAIPRAIGLKVASLFFWPFMIPSTVDGIRSYKSHIRMSNDFIAKGIKDEVVAPYSTIYRVHFASSEKVKDNFNFTVTEKESHNKQTKAIIIQNT